MFTVDFEVNQAGRKLLCENESITALRTSFIIVSKEAGVLWRGGSIGGVCGGCGGCEL